MRNLDDGAVVRKPNRWCSPSMGSALVPRVPRQIVHMPAKANSGRSRRRRTMLTSSGASWQFRLQQGNGGGGTFALAAALSFSQRASAPVPSGEQVVSLYLAPQLVQLELDLLLKLYPLPLLGHRVI